MNRGTQVPEQTTEWADASTTCFALSQGGPHKRRNEDRHVIRRLQDGSILLAVADGLGGDVAGEQAAQIIQDHLQAVAEIKDACEQIELDRIVRTLDRAVHRLRLTDPTLVHTGSTLLAVLLRDDTAHWVHVGDSRLYLLRRQMLAQITRDQTLARFLVAEGEITAQQAVAHYSRHVMDQWVGCGDVVPETGGLKLMSEDLLVLSSDGLHNNVRPDQFSAIAGATASLEIRAHALVCSALQQGGSDDMTIVLAARR